MMVNVTEATVVASISWEINYNLLKIKDGQDTID